MPYVAFAEPTDRVDDSVSIVGAVIATPTALHVCPTTFDAPTEPQNIVSPDGNVQPHLKSEAVAALVIIRRAVRSHFSLAAIGNAKWSSSCNTAELLTVSLAALT